MAVEWIKDNLPDGSHNLDPNGVCWCDPILLIDSGDPGFVPVYRHKNGTEVPARG